MLGAALADSYLGKVKTVFIFNIFYILGMVSLTVSAVPQISDSDNTSGTTNLILAMVGLFLISVGTGAIKPCVSSIGADQDWVNLCDMT